MRWQDQLRSLLEQGSYPTQHALADALREHGHRLNQATISRELRRIRARKVDGIYCLPHHAGRAAPVLSMSVTSGGCLVVLRTQPAHAALLAQRVDLAEITGVLGTIAGEDTVFVAIEGPESIAGLKRCLAQDVEDDVVGSVGTS